MTDILPISPFPFTRDTKYADPRNLREKGVIQEVNRCFLHPLGLALCVIPGENPDDPYKGFDVIVTNDPEGFVFDDLSDEISALKADIVGLMMGSRAKARERLFNGEVVQPLGSIVDHDNVHADYAWRKQPVVIEARETGLDHDEDLEIMAWCDGRISGEEDLENTDRLFYIETLEGPLWVSSGDFVIKGVEGEFYSCKPDIFHKTYERP